MKKKLYGIVEVGSHTSWLMVASAEEGGMQPLLQKQEICRLGDDVSEGGPIAAVSLRKLEKILLHFRQTVRNTDTELRCLVFTEALRRAENRSEVLQLAENIFSISAVLLNGKEEAELCWSSVHFRYGGDAPVVVDIGGGSTEISDGERRHSLSLGVLDLADRFGSVPGADIQGYVKTVLENAGLDVLRGRELFFTGGSAQLLAMQVLGLDRFDTDKIEGCTFDLQSLDRVRSRLVEMAREIRNQLPGMDEGRGDLFLPGLAVLRGVVEQLAPSSLRVSALGLRFGILQHELFPTKCREARQING